MKLEPILGKPLVEDLQHFLRILPILKTENELIGKSNLVSFAFQPRLHHVPEPLIQYVMKVDVRQQGANHLPLSGSLLGQQEPAVINHADIDPLPYQSQDASICHSLLDHLHELTSNDVIEVAADISLQNERDGSATHVLPHL